MAIDTTRDVAATPDAEALRHRGRRRVAFIAGGALVGALIGIVGFTVVEVGGGHTWGVAAVAAIALAVAGGLGGAVIGALMEVSVEDGEDEQLLEHAREEGGPIDETDVHHPLQRELRDGDEARTGARGA